METPQFLPTSFFRHRYSYAGLALVVAVLFDILIWQSLPGFGFVVFVACSVIGFIVLAQTTKHIHQPRAHLLLIPIALMTFSIALYNNDFVTYAAPPIILLLLALYCLLLTLRPSSHKFDFLSIPAFRGISLWLRNLNKLVRDVFTFRKHTANVAMLVAAGIIIAIPILVIFTALFRSADPVFDAFFLRVFNFNFDTEVFAQNVWRVIRTIVITGFLGTLFYIFLDDDHALVGRSPRAERYNGIITTVILTLMNILFAVFVFFQIKYLFLSADGVIEMGRTYAEVAREGFFQLTWVLVFAGLLLVTIYRSYSYHDHPWIVKALELLFVIFIGVVAASALKRMNLYQAEYGFTVLRLYVEWFIYAVLVLLVLSFVSILRNMSFRHFVHATMILVVGVGSVVSLVNVDRVIARENITRFLEQDKKLDLRYLSGLSVDVLPEVKRLIENPKTKYACLNTQVDSGDIIFSHIDAIAIRTDSWRSMNMGVIQALAFHDIRAQINNFSTWCARTTADAMEPSYNNFDLAHKF